MKKKKKFYIPDAYIPSLNLEVEIKQGGSNPNMHPKMVQVDKVKENLKDEMMKSQKDINYIKIVDKDYTNFFKYITDRKLDYLNNENVQLSDIIKESMMIIDDLSSQQ